MAAIGWLLGTLAGLMILHAIPGEQTVIVSFTIGFSLSVIGYLAGRDA